MESKPDVRTICGTKDEKITLKSADPTLGKRPTCANFVLGQFPCFWEKSLTESKPELRTICGTKDEKVALKLADITATQPWEKSPPSSTSFSVSFHAFGKKFDGIEA